MNGTSDWLTNFAANTAMYGNAGSGVTYSVWVKFTAIPATNLYLMNISGSNFETTMEYDSAGNLRFFNFEGGVGFHGNATVAISLSTGVWYRITGTYDLTNYNIYLNATLENQVAGSTPVGSGASNWSVGNQGSSSNFTNGVFADAAMWSVALTPLEIQGLVRGVRPGRIRPRSLLTWCPLDGLASPEPDLSGNGQALNINGTALAFGPPMSLFTPNRGVRFEPFTENAILTPQIVM